MKLLLDLGNSRLKWAWLSGGRLQDAGAELYRGQSPARVLQSLEPPAASREPGEIRLASTAGPDRNDEILGFLAARFDCPIRQARPVRTAGRLASGYDDPGQLGVDRWLAMRAATHQWSDPLCIVDAGTATTVDLVSESGQHLGGVIIPGLRLMHSALRQETGDLDRLAGPADPWGPLARAGDFVGRDTGSAIRLGILRATSALVEGAMAALQSGNQEGRLVVTGGDGPYLVPWLRGQPELEPGLVLKGLALATDPELELVRTG